jgi:hypothetical protein
MRRTWYPFLIAVGAVLFAGCTDAPPADTAPGVFLATHPQGPAVMTALFQGRLAVRDGCVLIERGGDYSVPVWPEGYTAERGPSGQLTVRNADGRTIAIEGEAFEMGGGYRAEFRPAAKVEPKEDQIQRLTEFLGYEIPARCLGADVYGVWLVGETQPVVD